MGTLQKADPTAINDAQIDACITYVETVLTDPETGALWEDDTMARDGAKSGDLRAQNPHMHMFEAVLQAYEMTGDAIWLDRAKVYMGLGAKHFIDPVTGAMCEFIGHDLTQNDTEMGTRREPGHQFEWAWLLMRYAEFSGDDAPRALARRMLDFVEEFGIRSTGIMAGATYDATNAAGDVTEATHLLWPLTEAGKVYSAMARETGDTAAAARAKDLSLMIFSDYFADDKPAWINQLDENKNIVWNEGLTRLLYHVAFFITEGARAKIWTIK
jgi:mannose-6-phosphate isomerase